jgi:hypothetical protein
MGCRDEPVTGWRGRPVTGYRDEPVMKIKVRHFLQ